MKDRKKKTFTRERKVIWKLVLSVFGLDFFKNLYGKRKKSFKGKGQKENQASKI